MFIFKAIGVALLAAIIGYIAGLVLGMLAVNAFSPNTFDKSVEAAMTGAFVCGPVMALAAAVAGLVIYWRWAKPA